MVGRASLFLVASCGLVSAALAGCTWSTTTSVGPRATIETRVYYDPETLERCVPDCPGDRGSLECLDAPVIHIQARSDSPATASPRPTGPAQDEDQSETTGSSTQTESLSSAIHAPTLSTTMTKTLLLTATAPTPVRPDQNGPLTYVPTTASPTGAAGHLRPASVGAILAMAVAFVAL